MGGVMTFEGTCRYSSRRGRRMSPPDFLKVLQDMLSGGSG